MEVPERIARELRTCALEHGAHLGSKDHKVSFDVKLSSDGEVDTISLRESTLGDDGLETCMASALRSLTEDDLSSRRSQRERRPVRPESLALLGQEELRRRASARHLVCWQRALLSSRLMWWSKFMWRRQAGRAPRSTSQ